MDMLMYCINKNDSNIYRIYDISYDSSGYPMFLYYDNNQWVRSSAKHFIPIEPEFDEEFDEEFGGDDMCDGDCLACGSAKHILPLS